MIFQTEKILRNISEYRYIYTLIQICCVAAVNDNRESLSEASQLKGLKYKDNPYTSLVLNADYGKAKAFVLMHVIPANYETARKICKKVFTG